jgi:hypothetical protein
MPVAFASEADVDLRHRSGARPCLSTHSVFASGDGRAGSKGGVDGSSPSEVLQKPRTSALSLAGPLADSPPVATGGSRSKRSARRAGWAHSSTSSSSQTGPDIDSRQVLTRVRRVPADGRLLPVTTDIYGHWERAERKLQAAKMEGVFPV